jgi:hypothetical protein
MMHQRNMPLTIRRVMGMIAMPVASVLRHIHAIRAIILTEA